MKCGRPARKTSHLVMAHATARNSSSIIAYRLSGSDKKRGSCLNEGPCVASLLLKNKAEVLVAGVCAKASFFVLVEV